jgi:hypothetical protein
MPTLSQLSYGPFLPSKSTVEIKIVGPIHAELLVVVRAAQTKMNLCPTRELPVRQEEAAVELLAIRGICINLAFDVDSSQQTVPVSPC